MIIVRPTPGHNWQWFDINDPTRLTDGLPEQTVTALLPTENILLTKIELPKTRQPQKIIPYAIEEQIIEAPEAVHIDYSQQKSSNVYHVAVINNKLIQEYKTELQQSDITQAQSAIPDVLALTWQESSWSIVFLEERCLIRYGKNSGIATSADNAEFVVQKLLTEANEMPNFCSTHDCPQQIADLLNKHTVMTRVLEKVFSAEQIINADFNLIGKPKRKKQASTGGRGILTSILISIALLVLIGNEIANKIISNKISTQYTQNLQTISNRLGPEIASRIQADPVGALQSALTRLQSLRNNNKFLNGLNAIGQALAKTTHGDIAKLEFTESGWQITINATKQEQTQITAAFANSKFKYQTTARDASSISYRLLEANK